MRAVTSDFQVPIAFSTGARARPSRKELANIAPGLTSCWMTSQAPTPMIMVCTTRRRNFETARIMAPRLPAWICAALAAALSRRHRRMTPSSMPMARITSALRSAASVR